jgi:hypothetical protein
MSQIIHVHNVLQIANSSGATMAPLYNAVPVQAILPTHVRHHYLSHSTAHHTFQICF